MVDRVFSYEVDPDRLPEMPALSVYFGGEFLDRIPPEVQWVIPGLIPQGVPSVMASQPGLGKSFLFLQAAIAIATGKPFLGYPAGVPRGAVFFGLEDGKDMFHRRVRSIIELYKWVGDWTDADEANFRKNFSAPFINWKSGVASSFLPDLMPNLELLILDYASRAIAPGIMVIDTLARVSDGDENTVQGLRPVLNACARIAETGWSPITLHHVGKGQDGARNAKDKPTLADRMSTEWIRGTGAIVGNFRCALQFARITEAEAEGAGLDPEDARLGRLLVFGCTKFNNGPKSDWVVIQQDDHGRWSLHPESIEILARVRGSKAVAALKVQDALLVALWDAQKAGREPDRADLAQRFTVTAKDPQRTLRQMICRLRSKGWVQPNGDALTASGVSYVSGIVNGGTHRRGESHEE